jgi:cobalt/nickel transport system ATP-binding protein
VSHHRIAFDQVRYAYPDGTQALDGVTFRLVHGESVGLVGANGSGKSTLLSHLNGLLLPQTGLVTVGEVPVRRETLADIRRHVGLVFQDPDDQLFMPTVLEDVAFGPLNLGMSPAEANNRALQALEAVGSASLAHRPPQHLSLGQRSAVAVAAVLALEPDVLALDEPAARLDPRARRRLIGLLKGFRHTKIVASHDLDLVLDLCDRVLILKDGRLLKDGPCRELLSDLRLLDEAGLEAPLSLGLIAPDGVRRPGPSAFC